MSEKIYLGSFEPADIVVIPAGVIERANDRLDAERAAGEKARQAAIADTERARGMRRARAMRRLSKVLKLFARMR
jgi:hypothetical protein